ncbi:MAG: hypothetical protein ACJ8AW_19340 [Rhodopila sp.]|jgi:hypothetical protein
MSKPVGQQLAARVLEARSPLHQWLFENRTEIAAVLAGQVRPGWQALANTVADNGVTDQHGKPPTRHAVRKAWKAIERSMNKPAQQPALTPSVPVAHHPVVEQQPILKPPPVIPDAPFTTQSRPRNVFKVATFKKDT